MSKIVFGKTGEVDWNEVETGSGSNSSKDLFMRLEEGENVVRVMGRPFQFHVHWIQTSDNKKRKIVSASERNSLTDKLEDAGFKRQPKWIVKVLDRDGDQFKVMEIGSQILNGIKALAQNNKWGDVRNYDLSIHRGPKGSQPLYTVTPNPKEKLGTEFKSQFDSFEERLDLSKLTTPTETNEVCTMLGWSASEFGAEAKSNASDDDFDFNFE